MKDESTSCYYVYLWIRSAKSLNGDAGTPYYIGKGKRRRAYQSHQGIKPPRDRSRIVIVAKNLNETDAFQIEILLIHFWGRIDIGTGCLRNRTNGGEGVSGLSQEGRAKISAKLKGRPGVKGKPVPLEMRKRISEALKGQRLSPERIAKISATVKKWYKDNPEQLDEMRNRAIEYFKNPEARERLSVTAKEQWNRPNFRETMSIAQQKTHCKYGHELAGDNLRYRRGGGRFCKTCAYIRSSEWRRKRRKKQLSVGESCDIPNGE